MAKSLQKRVIALDLRARKVGYVVFEGPNKLLDWGKRTYARGEQYVLEPILSDLRRMFGPSVIVIRKTANHYNVRQPMIDRALRTIKRFAKTAFLLVRVIDGPVLRRFFSEETHLNKQSIARLVADRFPELSWRLPRKRRAWESESGSQPIFDALSAGVFYFAQQACT